MSTVTLRLGTHARTFHVGVIHFGMFSLHLFHPIDLGGHLVEFGWLIFELFVLFGGQDTLEKFNVLNALIETLFIQQEKLGARGLERRFVDYVRLEERVEFLFGKPDLAAHFASECITGATVGVELCNLFLGKSESAVHFVFKVEVPLLFKGVPFVLRFVLCKFRCSRRLWILVAEDD